MRARTIYKSGTRLVIQRSLRLPYDLDCKFVEKCAQMRISVASAMEALVRGWLDGRFVIEPDALRRGRTNPTDDEQ